MKICGRLLDFPSVIKRREVFTPKRLPASKHGVKSAGITNQEAEMIGGFVISDIVFGCDNPTYNPSPVQELSLLNQFSGITTLQSLVLEKQCKGA